MKKGFIKKIALAFAFCLIGVAAFGQDDDDDYVPVKQPFSVAHLYASGGAAIPVGLYQSKGYALTGTNFSLNMSSTVDDSVMGIVCKIGYGRNPVDCPSLANYLTSHQRGLYYLPDSSGYYSYTTVLIGSDIYCQAARRFGFNLQALAGVIIAYSPKTSLNGHDTSGVVFNTSTQRLVATGFCYEFCFGLNYLLTKHVCAFFDASFIHASPKAMGAAYEVFGSNAAPSPTSVFGSATMPHSVITLKLGIGFKLEGLHHYTQGPSQH